MPAAGVEAGHDVARLGLGQRRRPLHIAIEMVEAGRRHQRVVLMVEPVPDAIFLGDAHVAHLDGQEIFERRLPDVARIDVAADPERGGSSLLAIAEDVHAGLADLREIERQ